MTLAQLAPLHQLEDLLGETQETYEVRDRDAAAPHAAPDLLDRQAQLLDEHRAGAGLLHGVEVLARHVLDQRRLERQGIVIRTDQAGDRLQARELGCAPAALAAEHLR